MVRPHMDFTFHCLSSHVNTVYVLCTKPGVITSTGRPIAPLKLKGEMILLPEVDLLLFVASPVVLNLHELNQKGTAFYFQIYCKVVLLLYCSVKKELLQSKFSQ